MLSAPVFGVESESGIYVDGVIKRPNGYVNARLQGKVLEYVAEVHNLRSMIGCDVEKISTMHLTCGSVLYRVRKARTNEACLIIWGLVAKLR